MQDPHVRAVYEGLKGHGSRQSFMEEFLTGLGVKELRDFLRRGYKKYDNLSGHVPGEIAVRAKGWGYISLEAEADGDFIHLLKRNATQEDLRTEYAGSPI